MSDTPRPRPMPKQFRGRDFVVPGAEARPLAADAPAAAAEPAAPGPRPMPRSPAAGAGAPARPKSERERKFERYAELRGKLAESPGDAAVLVEAASAAEELSLTIESIELWREVLAADPQHPEATKRLAELDRRAAATGETGAARAPVHRVREQPPEAPPFWTDLGRVASYPFRGRGLGVFVGASLFFAVGEVVATFNVFFGWFTMLCLLGYLAAWQFDVISRTAAGRDDPPEFPEVVSVVDSCVMPFLGFLGCVAFAYAPVIACVLLMIQGTLPLAVGVPAAVILFVPCGFVFPMTLTVRALTQSIGESMNPARVYGAIARVLPDYVLTFLTLCVLWGAWSVVRVGVLLVIGLVFGLPTADAVLRLDFLRIAGWFIYTAAVWPLFLYVWCVQGHVLGALYRQSYKRLAWFVPATGETAKARRLSVAVALAGAGGALLLGGAGWLTYALWPGAGTRAMLNGGPCPIPPGAALTYYWESSDGPCGDATYRFESAADGRIAVRARYRRATDFGLSVSEAPVAVIERSTGNVTRGDGESTGIALSERTGLHTRFYGGKRGTMNSSYLNDWTVRGETRFRSRWDAWRVVDPDTGTELYYDKATGILVGRRMPGIGVNLVEWLVAAPGMPSLTSLPGPNRDLDALERIPEDRPDAPSIDIDAPEPFGFPPRRR